MAKPLNQAETKKLEYKAEIKWDNECGGEVSIRHFPPLRLDTPVEFGGKGRYPCPDELFVAAVGGCLLTTFLYFQRTRDLHPAAIKISIKGTVAYHGSQGYRLAEIDATVSIEAKEDEKTRVEEYAELAKKYCHITRVLEKALPVKISIKIQ